MTEIGQKDTILNRDNYILLLEQLSQQLVANPALNIQKIVEFTHHYLGGACSLYNKLNPRNQSLISWSAGNAPADLPDADQAAGHICYEATIKGKDTIVIIEDIAKTDYQDSDPYVKKFNLRSYLGAPVKNETHCFGSLCIVDTKTRQFGNLEIRMIRHLANILRLQEERLQMDKTQTILYKLARSLMTSQNISELATEIKNHIKDVIDIDYYALIVPEKNPGTYTAYRDKEKSVIPKQTAEYFLIKTLHQTRKTILLDSATKTDLLPAELKKDLRFHSWLGAPLLLNDQFLGVIIIASKNEHAYIEGDLNLLEFISYEIAHILHEKKLEENLRAKEKSYRTIFEQSPIGIYRIDLDGNILMANPALAKLLEYNSVDDLLQGNFNNAFHSDFDRKTFWDLLKNKSSLFLNQTCWQTLNNNVIFVREKANLNQHHDTPVIDGIVEDITAEVNSKNAYLFEKQKFETLSQKVPLGILQVDNNDKIIKCNPQVKKITGYDCKQIKNLATFFQKISPDDQPAPDINTITNTATVKILTKKGIIRCVKILQTEMVDKKFLVTIEDVSDAIRIKDDLVIQSKYLSAINSATNLMISEKKVPYQKILKLIANTLDLPRAVFLKAEIRDNHLFTTRLSDWNSDHLSKDTAHIQKKININKVLPNWYREIRQKRSIYGNYDDFNAPEQHFLDKIGIQSLYIHRVDLNQEIYGILVMEEFHKNRNWSENDRILIHSIASTMAKFIEQKFMQNQLENSKTSYMDLFQNSSFGIVIFDEQSKIININQKALSLFEKDNRIFRKKLNLLWKDPETTATVQASVDFCHTMNISKKIQIKLKNTTNAKVLDLDFKKMKYFDLDCIIMYVYDITTQYEREKQIKENLAEKQTLLQEIHHRVKNNLQVISSLLNLQLKDIETEQDRELFIDSQNRIKSIALIHESLYHTDNLAKINLRSYTENLVSRLFTIFKVNSNRIKYEIQIPAIELDIKKAIPCGLILDELINNSLKYAFPYDREGKITISVEQTEQDYKMIVKDNGIGFKQGNLLKGKSTLGFVLVITLTKQLRGNYKIFDDKGFGIEIIFPRQG